MKKIAYLLTLIMLLVPLAGCAGDDNDDNPIEGDWYHVGELMFQFNQDGTVQGSSGNGNWETEANGNYITLYFESSVTTHMFEVRENWLFILEEDGNNCVELSRDIISSADWEDARNNQQPYPSFCSSGGSPAVLGCMNEDAENYNPEATKDDGSCTYSEPEPN